MRRRRHAVVLAVAAGVVTALVGMAPAAGAVPRCLGRPATIVGTPGDDTLGGTVGRDVIAAGGGWDVVEGLGGDDVLCGGAGSDVVRGGAGEDRIHGGGGSDTVHGGADADRVWGGRGGVEGIFGGPGDDRLFGGRGSFDSLVGGAGDDLVHGGPGRDLAEFWDSPVGVVADLETDTATGHGDDTIPAIEGLIGSNHDDVLLGDGASNLLVGQAGEDEIRARGSGALSELGADVLDGGPGDDVIDGGPGDDIVTFEDAPEPVTVDLQAGEAAGWGVDVVAGVEAVIGSFGNDVLRGGAGDDAFVGGAGDDVIDGRGGRDQAAFFDAFTGVVVDLHVGAASGWGEDAIARVEVVTGSAFADLIVGDDGPNELDGGGGDDALVGAGDDDVLVGAAGRDRADGGPGFDACAAEVQLACEGDAASAAPPRLAAGDFGAAWLALRDVGEVRRPAR